MDLEFHRFDLDDLEGDLVEALTYWRSLKGSRPMPSWAEFDLLRIPPGAVVTTHVTDVVAGRDDYKIRF